MRVRYASWPTYCCRASEIKINPRMHTGIACHVIPVCIWGSRCNPRMHTGIDLDPRMHTEICTIPVCIRGSDGH